MRGIGPIRLLGRRCKGIMPFYFSIGIFPVAAGAGPGELITKECRHE